MFEIGVIIEKADDGTFDVWFTLPEDGDDWTNGFVAGTGFPSFKVASDAVLALAGPNLTIRHVLLHKEKDAECTTCHLPFDPNIEGDDQGECDKCANARAIKERETFGLGGVK